MNVDVPDELFPYAPHYFAREGIRMHYVDEGQGPPVVMLHGNPTWSFMYRDLLAALSPTYRCIAPDHIGMGRSDKPDDGQYDYTLRRRVDDLDALLTHLDLTAELTLVAHDWGGMVAMAWAAEHPERVARLVLMNTAAFPLPAGRRLPAALQLSRTPAGAWLIRRFNAFAQVASRVCVRRQPMRPEVRRAYVAPYASYEDRIATLRFVQDIPIRPTDRAYPLVAATEARLSQFVETPTLILWGDRDFVFDHHILARWRELLPHAKVVRFLDAGHYVLEDAGREIIPLVRDFLAEQALTARPGASA